MALSTADLHVHSIYSEHPSEWFMKNMGARESYTDPEYLYRTAKERGMAFVTITDHNRIDGALLLKEKHPGDVFTGLEASTRFPEDGCEIHVLVYGLTPAEYDEIQVRRKDIYVLRDYLRSRKLASSVSHPTYSLNDRLTVNTLEKLILLFDVYEGINGGRNRLSNEIWTDLIGNLTPGRIWDLYRKHRIEPLGAEPWIKGFTGGSDDHSGIFVGATFTAADAGEVPAFIDALKTGTCRPGGRHSDFHSLVFTVYKGLYDHSKQSGGSLSRSFLSRVTEMVFEKKPLRLRDKIKLLKWRLNGRKGSRINELFADLLVNFPKMKAASVERRLELVYERIAVITDEFFKKLFRSLDRDIRKVDIVAMVRNASSSLPGFFLSLPFFWSAKHLNESRSILDELRNSYGMRRSKKILWCTDTLCDLNGVAVMLKKIGWLSVQRGAGLQIVTSLTDAERRQELPPCIMDLPSIHTFNLPQYESYLMKVPSVLRSLKMMHDFDPDEIYISTPGPVGLLGLLVAKHLNVRSVGVYHTDFYLQTKDITGDENVAGMLESYTRWFYACMDEVRVPTSEYMRLLEARGFRPEKMKLLKKGIDHNLFFPRLSGKRFIRERFKVNGGVHLLFAGRVSKDKNLDFLIDVFKDIAADRDGVNFLIAGDGPWLKELRRKAGASDRIVFTGRLDHAALPELYSGADFFVFPSTTDTFGMVVLEAQACGLPVLVSDEGGPKEIVQDGVTGFVLAANDRAAWKEKLISAIAMLQNDPGSYARMRENARSHAVENSSWDAVLDDIIGAPPAPAITVPVQPQTEELTV